MNLQFARRHSSFYAHDAAAIFHKSTDLGLHPKVKGRIASGVFSEEVQEIPLRHQRDEFAFSWQNREIGRYEFLAPHLRLQLWEFLMGTLQKLWQESELVHELESGRMDSIAPEVAEEIAVFLENDDVDAGSRQQEPEHHSGRTPTGYATSNLEVFKVHQVFPLEADYGYEVVVSISN